MSMKSVRIFLIESAVARHRSVKHKLSSSGSIKLHVTATMPRMADAAFKDAHKHVDIVVFSEKITAGTVIQLTKIFRARHLTIPIFVLTEEPGARLPRNFRRAGVDDMVGMADIDTPLFSWTFMSTIQQTVLRKKAREYDSLHRRLRSVNDSISTLMHEMNNPLSVIRLALYHLENPELSEDKRSTFLKLLVSNLERVENYVKDLRMIRRQLGGETPNNAKIFPLKPTTSSAAMR